MSVLLEIRNLKKYFHVPDSWLHATDDVPFSPETGRTLGIVGELDYDRSALGHIIVRPLDSTEGEICFDGKRITDVRGKELKRLHTDMQIIFQDLSSSLSPRMAAKQIIAGSLRCCERLSAREIDKRVNELTGLVGLVSRLTGSYPHGLNGGRRQRIGIARALTLNPRFVVCGEPVSALDIPVQTRVLNLMQDLQERSGLTYIPITHDLSVVKHTSDEITVVYLGQIVEKYGSNDLFKDPRHPYTKALLSVIPIPSLGVKRERIFLGGELTSPVNPRPSYRSTSRCPCAGKECLKRNPLLVDDGRRHFAACHHI